MYVIQVKEMNRMQTFLKRLLSIMLSVFVFMIYISAFCSENITKAQKQLCDIASFEFEDDQFDGWTVLGECSFLLDKTIKYSGSSSLKISNRKKSWCGSSYNTNSLFKAGHTYFFSFYVYQDSGSDEKIYATIKHSNSNGVTDYIHINDMNNAKACTAVSGEWFEIKGTVKIPEDTVSSLLYIEAPNQAININLDHILISEEAEGSDTSSSDIPVITGNSQNDARFSDEFKLGFENSDINMIPRGETIRLVKTDEISKSGKHSLYVSQRENTWNGPSVETSFIKKETEYYCSVYVYYDDAHGKPNQDFIINISYCISGKLQFTEVGQKNVIKKQWTKIEGICVLPENASAAEFSVQTANKVTPEPSDLIDFYIDDIEIVDLKLHQKQNTYKISINILILFAVLLLLIFLTAFLIKKRTKYLKCMKTKDIDEMTKVFNRNAYEKIIDFYEKNTQETEKLFVLTCDLDNLKTINDNFGHEKGDEAIKRCAEVLRNTIGWEGEVYRIGGDEFVCFTKISLLQICRTALTKEGEQESDYRFSATLGQSSFKDLKTDEFTPSVKDIIKKADEMMYKEKEEKKNL